MKSAANSEEQLRSFLIFKDQGATTKDWFNQFEEEQRRDLKIKNEHWLKVKKMATWRGGGNYQAATGGILPMSNDNAKAYCLLFSSEAEINSGERIRIKQS
ncbi:MAG: hypothetical protein AB7F59_06875 [Bdellovibrionales bacterium]